MEKCYKKAHATIDAFELDQETLHELWLNTSIKKYFIKQGKCYLGFPSIMKCYIWLVDTDGVTKKKICNIDDWLMLCEDFTVDVVKKENINNWNDLILPNLSMDYFFTPKPT